MPCVCLCNLLLHEHSVNTVRDEEITSALISGVHSIITCSTHPHNTSRGLHPLQNMVGVVAYPHGQGLILFRKSLVKVLYNAVQCSQINMSKQPIHDDTQLVNSTNHSYQAEILVRI